MLLITTSNCCHSTHTQMIADANDVLDQRDQDTCSDFWRAGRKGAAVSFGSRNENNSRSMLFIAVQG